MGEEQKGGRIVRSGLALTLAGTLMVPSAAAFAAETFSEEAYLAQHQKEPTVEEIAAILGIRREDVVFALDAILEPISLYEPIYSDSGDTVCVMDQVRDTKNTDERWMERIALKEAVGHLTERERKILSMRFFQGKTQMEVSSEIGISQAQVSRLEKNALRQIRKEL